MSDASKQDAPAPETPETPHPDDEHSPFWSKGLTFVVIIVVGSAIALYGMLKYDDMRVWMAVRESQELVEKYSITPEKPAGPDTFFPLKRLDPQPVVEGIQILTSAEAGETVRATVHTQIS